MGGGVLTPQPVMGGGCEGACQGGQMHLTLPQCGQTGTVRVSCSMSPGPVRAALAAIAHDGLPVGVVLRHPLVLVLAHRSISSASLSIAVSTSSWHVGQRPVMRHSASYRRASSRLSNTNRGLPSSLSCG